MTMHRDRHLLSACLGAWASAYLSLAAEARARRAQAALMWTRRLLSLALFGWQGESEMLAIKREKQRQADAQARQWSLHRTLGCWFRISEEQQGARVAKTRRLRDLREQLGRAKSTRVLAAWVELHSQAVMEAFQVGGRDMGVTCPSI
jgi:hypothetical protein